MHRQRFAGTPRGLHEPQHFRYQRAARQRQFVTSLLKSAAVYVAEHPLDAASVMRKSTSAFSVDEGLQLIDLARKLRPAATGGSVSYALPVSLDMISGMSVVRIAHDAAPLLAYFAGTGPAPAEPQS